MKNKYVDIIKNILSICSVLLFIYIINDYNVSKDNDSIYKVDISKNKVEICNKETYIKNFTYNDEFELYEFIKEIEAICKYN